MRIEKEISPEAEVMREVRWAAQLTQRELGVMMGFSPGIVGQLESGMWRPSAEYIRIFCSSLALPLSMEARLTQLRAEPWLTKREKKKTPGVKILRKKKLVATFSHPDAA